MNESFEDSDFPTVFCMADKCSIDSQKEYLNKIKLNAFLGTISIGLALFTDTSKISLALLVISLVFCVISMWSLVSEQKEKSWYRSRALAESVKSLTWKYIIGGEPFIHDLNIDKVNKDFIIKIKGLREEHKLIFRDMIISDDNLSIITEKMKKIRSFSDKQRAEYYLKERIQSQKEWYIKKSKYNGKRSKFWSHTIVVLLVCALVFAVLKSIFPEYKYYPIELCIFLSTCSFTWLQTKRFNELNAAYNLTAHEIADIEVEMTRIINTNLFENYPEFISDCETAFSREHTQWLARRDSLS
ncbi:DUF4231 domain-containing protein [Psychrobacter sp. SZ93C1]|uniref:DUF4231 domain-containing protein n=1 Tax=Psychrobacter sp. SZ93C1 TaxID=2792058 RepID=UPI0018CE5A80|nr:DUF4231 domain-containing protein [Psychrobacter sp. SZ93C1]MBH0063889.1 DUF4231 domain-containing protein [Psychrobacter sp. SZ93C1]